jgi:hypothetical protein
VNVGKWKINKNIFNWGWNYSNPGCGFDRLGKFGFVKICGL